MATRNALDGYPLRPHFKLSASWEQDAPKALCEAVVSDRWELEAALVELYEAREELDGLRTSTTDRSRVSGTADRTDPHLKAVEREDAALVRLADAAAHRIASSELFTALLDEMETPERANLLASRYDCGRPWAEVARQLGMSPNNATSYALRAALEELAEVMRRHGITGELAYLNTLRI